MTFILKAAAENISVQMLTDLGTLRLLTDISLHLRDILTHLLTCENQINVPFGNCSLTR